MTSKRKCSKAGCGAQEIIGKPCTDFDCPQQWVHHTRAVPETLIDKLPYETLVSDKSYENPTVVDSDGIPDVPELVRYSAVRRYGREEIIEKDEHGKYVLHSQAAEIIAAKDAEIERLRSLNHYAALEAQAIKRAEAAEAKNIELEDALLNAEGKISDLEAKLAQYEAQEPVAWMHPEAGWTDVCKVTVANHCKHGIEPLPLYASPAPAADLKAANERLRMAARLLLDALDDDENVIYFKAMMRAALNPSETRT